MASFDDELGEVDHARAGVDVDGPVGDAERHEDDRKHDARVPVDGFRSTRVRVLSDLRRRRRRRDGSLGLDDVLVGVATGGHLLLLMMVVVRLARRRWLEAAATPLRAASTTSSASQRRTHRDGGVGHQQADVTSTVVTSPHPTTSLLHSTATSPLSTQSFRVHRGTRNYR